MNDIELKEVIAIVLMEAMNDLALHYKAPIVPGSCHSIELEDETCLGTISVLASGMMDWHIFDIATSAEALIGHSEVRDADAVRNKLVDLFREIRARDRSC